MSVFRVISITPAGESVVENGITHRPASWPTAAAAQAWIDYWTTPHHFNPLRDKVPMRYRVAEVEREAA